MDHWVEFFTASAAWASVVLSVVLYLHARRTSAVKEIKEQIQNLAEKTTREHKEADVQVRDISKTISDNYVTQREFNSGIYTLTSLVNESRKDIGNLHNRIDEMLNRLLDKRN